MRFAAALLLALLLTSASLVVAQGSGNAERGRTKAEPCAACHGADGNSTMPDIPSLAGQPETFTGIQLFLFREQIRQVPPMLEFVKGLTDGDIADLAAYYAGLRPQPDLTPRDAAKHAQGAALATRLYCANCHLPSYAGREQMPRLASQREDYLRHALKQYRDNERVGSDTSMNAAMYGVSDSDIAALAHYVSQPR
jgi:cytochrome c553